MRVLSSEKVERLIATDKLTGWEKGKYLIILMVLGFFSRPFALVSPIFSRPPWIVQTLDLATVAVSILIIVYGTKRCFKINEAIDHQNFIERFAVLSVPISVKIVIIAIPSIFVLQWLTFSIFSRDNPDVYQYVPGFFYVIGPVINFVYYFFLKRSFVRVGRLVNRKE
ncbi:MAG: hypothetical protein ACXVCD_18220 [Pseudobdellovibrionaceae bacterium]